jgi:hypothetical protein
MELPVTDQGRHDQGIPSPTKLLIIPGERANRVAFSHGEGQIVNRESDQFQRTQPGRTRLFTQ